MDRRLFLLGGAASAFAVGAQPSALLAAEPRMARDIVYGEPDGHRLLMDIYQPDGPGPHPAVILVHGGGWLGGSKAGHVGTGKMLARTGYVACAINYRLAPQFPYPAAFDDCQRAVRWIRAHAGAWDVNPKAIGALGDSAGGHLVGLIGVRETRDNRDELLADFSSRPDAVIPYYGAFELVRMWDIEMAHKPLTAWLGGHPDQHRRVYRLASPVAMASRGAPPHLILHGDKDAVNPLEQSELFHQALKRKGVDTTLVVLPGAGHGWAMDSPTGQHVERLVLGFFAKHLKRK